MNLPALRVLLNKVGVDGMAEGKEARSMQARDLIHLAERIYVITMPERGQGSSWYRINDEETFVEQIAQHPSFKGCTGPQASGVYVLTFEADTPETEQVRWIAQVLSGTDLDDGHGGTIRSGDGIPL